MLFGWGIMHGRSMPNLHYNFFLKKMVGSSVNLRKARWKPIQTTHALDYSQMHRSFEAACFGTRFLYRFQSLFYGSGVHKKRRLISEVIRSCHIAPQLIADSFVWAWCCVLPLSDETSETAVRKNRWTDAATAAGDFGRGNSAVLLQNQSCEVHGG